MRGIRREEEGLRHGWVKDRREFLVLGSVRDVDGGRFGGRAFLRRDLNVVNGGRVARAEAAGDVRVRCRSETSGRAHVVEDDSVVETEGQGPVGIDVDIPAGGGEGNNCLGKCQKRQGKRQMKPHLGWLPAGPRLRGGFAGLFVLRSGI